MFEITESAKIVCLQNMAMYSIYTIWCKWSQIREIRESFLPRKFPVYGNVNFHTLLYMHIHYLSAGACENKLDYLRTHCVGH